MKVVYEPISFSRTVAFQRITHYNLDVATIEAANSLLDMRDKYPVLTAQMRVLGIVAKRLEEVIDAGGKKSFDANAIMNAFSTVGRGMNALADAFTLWVVQSRSKLLEGQVTKETAASAVAILLETVDGKLLSAKETYDLVLHAESGVGPDRSESETLFIANSIVKSAKTYADTPETGPLAATARMAMFNLLAWLKHALTEKANPLSSMADSNAQEMLETRIATLKMLAGYVLGVSVSATYQVI